LNIVNTILEAGKKIFTWLSAFIKSRGIRKQYKEGEEAVKDGDVDEINDIITGHKG
jgi:hypothetical protein